MFADRQDAALQLAKCLKSYEGAPCTYVVGLPRGGVLTAGIVAKQLHLPLDIVCPRKISTAFEPEYALGAIAEGGEPIFDETALHFLGLTPNSLKEETEKAHLESKRRTALYRTQKADLKGKTVIVVDDGIATGLTMKAAVNSLRQQGASYLIIAVPVLPADRIDKMEQIADKLYYILAPFLFHAVGQFYADFRSIEDQEVLEILKNQEG